jgi:hypothetical protein
MTTLRNPENLDMMGHVCNPSTREAEVGGSCYAKYPELRKTQIERFLSYIAS